MSSVQFVTVRINNWKKFNPKISQKYYHWFKVSTRVRYSVDLYGLTAAQKWGWILLLNLAAEKKKEEYRLNVNWLAHELGEGMESAISLLKRLEECESITLKDWGSPSNSSTRIRIENRIEEEVSTSTTSQESTDVAPPDQPSEIKKQLGDKTFEFQVLYMQFPKRSGDMRKKQGMQKIQKQIKTQEHFDQFHEAVHNYNAHCLAHKAKDPTWSFSMQWGTFCSKDRWPDWVNPDNGTGPGNGIHQSIEELERDWDSQKSVRP